MYNEKETGKSGAKISTQMTMYKQRSLNSGIKVPQYKTINMLKCKSNACYPKTAALGF